MIDIIEENTHAKIKGGCRDRVFAIKMIYLKRLCLMTKKKLICCSTFCELLIYKVLTKFTKDNV